MAHATSIGAAEKMLCNDWYFWLQRWQITKASNIKWGSHHKLKKDGSLAKRSLRCLMYL